MDFKEIQRNINDLRRLQGQADEERYHLRLRIDKLQRRLTRVEQGELLMPHGNTAAIAKQQRRLRQIEEISRQIEQRLRELNSPIDTLAKNIRQLEGLRLETTEFDEKISSLEVLYRQVLSRQQTLRGTEGGVLNDLELLKKARSQVEDKIEALITENERLQPLTEKHHREIAQLQDQKRDYEEKRRDLQSSIEELAQPGEPDHERERLNAALTEARRREESVRADLLGLDNRLRTFIDILYQSAPQELVENLDDSTPFLLFPVRLETVFMPMDAGTELWVRIYPDDISVHTHERLLTEEEITEGESYWTWLRLSIDDLTLQADEKESRKRDAWMHLSGTVGAQRAMWIAQETKPTNWETATSSEDLAFPVHDDTKTHAWTRAPRATVLPDKFVLMAYQSDRLVQQIVGNSIPGELFLGPDPLKAADAFQLDPEKGVTAYGADFDWTVDIDKAISVGMGFKVPLASPFDKDGFDRLMVLGLRLSTDAAEGQRMVEDLLENHHYTPKGFSLVPQGTPTNNTETDGSGFTRNEDFTSMAYFVESGKPLFDPDSDTDGKHLADLLGIGYEPLQWVRYSDRRDFAEAQAMNHALYPATLGYFTEKLMQPVLEDDAIQSLRDFFTRYVTGRGPASAIRVGNQPYGILLTSHFTAWKWPERHVFQLSRPFMEKLLEILRHIQKQYDAFLDELSFVGKPGKQPEEILLDVLGLHSNSVEIARRVGYPLDYLADLEEFMNNKRNRKAVFDAYFQIWELTNLFKDFGYNRIGDDGKNKPIPEVLNILYRSTENLQGIQLIDSYPPSEDKTIDNGAVKNYLHWLSEISNFEALDIQDFGGTSPPINLLYQTVRTALLLQLKAATERWAKRRFDLPIADYFAAKHFYNITETPDLTHVEWLRTSVNKVNPELILDLSVADYFLGFPDEDEAEYLHEMKKAIGELANLPTARLERCFIEHLDTLTYRLDAWQTGFFYYRLHQQRNLSSFHGERKQGIYIGAFGWLENLRPSERRTVSSDELPKPVEGVVWEDIKNGGFVHAPSLNHAYAAALLRNAYLTHATSENPQVMSVNLSSERVRRALFLLESVANGQELEAVLGYQFERGLHDRNSTNPALKLNQYIFDFREKYPIHRHAVPPKGSSIAQETVPNQNVVNGLTLAENKDVYPYGVASLPLDDTAIRSAVEAEVNRLADSLDAVKDLLTAETVYQLVQGNFERAGAVTKALSDSSPIPEPEIIQTPRGSAFGFTNRVVVLFERTGANPWTPILLTPRASAEPALNAWLGKLLGNPEYIRCRLAQVIRKEDGTAEEILGTEAFLPLSDLALQPIDFIYLVGGGSEGGETELEVRIAYAYLQTQVLQDQANVVIEFSKNDQPNDPKVKTFAEILPLCQKLKTLISECQPLSARDFDPPSKKNPLSTSDNPDAFDLAELQTRIEAAINALRDHSQDLGALPIDITLEGVVLNTDLKTTASKLKEQKLVLQNTAFVFADVDLPDLRNHLRALADFGIPDAFPRSATGAGTEDKILLLEQAFALLNKVEKILAEAEAAFLEAKKPDINAVNQVRNLTLAGKAVLGENFNWMPLFAFTNAADVQNAWIDRALIASAATVSEWLQSTSKVRPKIGRWESVRLFAEVLNGTELEAVPIQLPYITNDSWLSIEFSAGRALQHDTISIALHTDQPFDTTRLHSGFLVDEWMEAIPQREEITGIAMNYNQPGATAPQCLLLCVTPEEAGHWKWDHLTGTLNDTLQRAKRRAVEPAHLDRTDDWSALLPALVSEFSVHPSHISQDYSMAVARVAEELKGVFSTIVQTNPDI
jgi:hypothetical protein